MWNCGECGCPKCSRGCYPYFQNHRCCSFPNSLYVHTTPLYGTNPCHAPGIIHPPCPDKNNSGPAGEKDGGGLGSTIPNKAETIKCIRNLEQIVVARLKDPNMVIKCLEDLVNLERALLGLSSKKGKSRDKSKRRRQKSVDDQGEDSPDKTRGRNNSKDSDGGHKGSPRSKDRDSPSPDRNSPSPDGSSPDPSTPMKKFGRFSRYSRNDRRRSGGGGGNANEFRLSYIPKYDPTITAASLLEYSVPPGIRKREEIRQDALKSRDEPEINSNLPALPVDPNDPGDIFKMEDGWRERFVTPMDTVSEWVEKYRQSGPVTRSAKPIYQEVSAICGNIRFTYNKRIGMGNLPLKQRGE